MTIEFNQVIPLPLRSYPHGEESIWNRKFSLDFPNKILLNASSGKGKSTFINTLYGLRKDYEGAIQIDHKNISEFTLDDWIALRRDRISVVFQDLQLFPDLTVLQNLKLKNDLTHHHTEEHILAMLMTMGIDDKKDQTCGTLSLGQQQRVAIIRALLQPFELLLMDEPFSHLDEVNTEIALKLIDQETDKNEGGFILTTLGSYHGFSYDQELNL